MHHRLLKNQRGDSGNTCEPSIIYKLHNIFHTHMNYYFSDVHRYTEIQLYKSVEPLFLPLTETKSKTTNMQNLFFLYLLLL